MAYFVGLGDVGGLHLASSLDFSSDYEIFVLQGGYAAYRYAQPTTATATAYSDR